MWFLGIDPSLTNVGIGVVGLEGAQNTQDHVRLIRTPTKYNKPGSVARLEYLRAGLADVLNELRATGPILFAVVEGCAYGVKGQGVQHAMGEGSGVLRLSVYHHCAHTSLKPSEWRSEIFGKGQGNEAKKDDAILEARRLLREQQGATWKDHDVFTDHEAEAYLLALCARRIYDKKLQVLKEGNLTIHQGINHDPHRAWL